MCGRGEEVVADHSGDFTYSPPAMFCPVNGLNTLRDMLIANNTSKHKWVYLDRI